MFCIVLCCGAEIISIVLWIRRPRGHCPFWRQQEGGRKEVRFCVVSGEAHSPKWVDRVVDGFPSLLPSIYGTMKLYRIVTVMRHTSLNVNTVTYSKQSVRQRRNTLNSYSRTVSAEAVLPPTSSFHLPRTSPFLAEDVFPS